MTRKAKYKNGASVVLGDLEGTMPVGVEDDDYEDEEEEEVDVEVSDHDRELTTLSRQPAYPNITRVGRITGSFVSAPSAIAPVAATTEYSLHTSSPPLSDSTAEGKTPRRADFSVRSRAFKHVSVKFRHLGENGVQPHFTITRTLVTALWSPSADIY